MNLKHLSDKDLLLATEKLVQTERELLTSVLHHFREMERRKLYSDLGFGSLFDYATQKLGYSSDQACRRIAAMRLLHELPEIEEKIQLGHLNLTHLSLAKTHFNREERGQDQKITKQAKIELLSQLENKSTREAEKLVIQQSSSPQAIKPDQIRPLAQELIEVRFVADEKLQQKLNKLRGLRASKNPHISLGELINELCDLALDTWDPSLPAAPRVKRKNTDTDNMKSSLKSLSALPKAQTKSKNHPLLMSNKISKPLSRAAIRREVWRRDHGMCTNCGSDYGVEIDHIRPRALGGNDSLANLRLLCRSCNRRAGIRNLGLKKMEDYIFKNQYKHPIKAQLIDQLGKVLKSSVLAKAKDPLRGI